MRSLPQDIGYFGRTVAKSPEFFAVAVLKPALGIGANTAMFSVVHVEARASPRCPEADERVLRVSGLRKRSRPMKSYRRETKHRGMRSP